MPPALAAALLAAALAAAAVPAGKEVIVLDLIHGKMGAVTFSHAAHLRYPRPDGAPMTCRDCHHNLAAAEPGSGAVLRCGGCHAGLGQPARAVEGKLAPALAQLKPDGAIDHKSVLFHGYCRTCHEKSKGGERMLVGCKVCHERGVGSDVLHGRYDQPSARTP